MRFRENRSGRGFNDVREYFIRSMFGRLLFCGPAWQPSNERLPSAARRWQIRFALRSFRLWSVQPHYISVRGCDFPLQRVRVAFRRRS